MKVYLNNLSYSFVIPFETLTAIGNPEFIQILHNLKEKTVIIQPVTSKAEGVYQIKMTDKTGFLAFPKMQGCALISSMGWGRTPQELEALVLDGKNGNKLLFLDLKKAHPTESMIHGPFSLPDCFKNEQETEEETEEEEDE